MGWGNCGEDSQGRPIGYYHAARCDHPGCGAKIDRGLSYACGGMHGTQVSVGSGEAFDGWTSCEGYFCEAHLRTPCVEHENGADLADTDLPPQLCPVCCRKLEEAYRDPKGDFREHWPTDAPPLPLDQPTPATVAADRGGRDGGS